MKCRQCNRQYTAVLNLTNVIIKNNPNIHRVQGKILVRIPASIIELPNSRRSKLRSLGILIGIPLVPIIPVFAEKSLES